MGNLLKRNDRGVYLRCNALPENFLPSEKTLDKRPLSYYLKLKSYMRLIRACSDTCSQAQGWDIFVALFVVPMFRYDDEEKGMIQ